MTQQHISMSLEVQTSLALLIKVHFFRQLSIFCFLIGLIHTRLKAPYFYDMEFSIFSYFLPKIVK